MVNTPLAAVGSGLFANRLRSGGLITTWSAATVGSLGILDVEHAPPRGWAAQTFRCEKPWTGRRFGHREGLSEAPHRA